MKTNPALDADHFQARIRFAEMAAKRAIFRLPADACSRLACRMTNATARQKR